MPDSLLPPPLAPGDTIAVFHPAGPVREPANFDSGLRLLRDLGLRVRHHPPSGSGPDYLAAADEERLRELHRLWADEEVKGLIAARGGYGCLRLVAQLDFSFMGRHPKWLIGFSDLSVLLNALYQQTGMIGLHGPVVTSLARMDRRALEIFKEQLGGIFRPMASIPGLEVLRGGPGQGTLIGGNLTSLVHMIGTPWQPSFDTAVLFLEDTGEAEYKLDRMLTQLFCCGLLDNLAGLILGNFDPGHDDRLETIRRNELVWNRVLELSSNRSYPVWGGFPAGHRGGQYPLPIGMAGVMNSDSGSLEFFPPGSAG
jgi:muramoyltetrapeptide carboxypeptidase